MSDITNDDIYDLIGLPEEEKVADNELILPNGKKIIFNDQQFEAIKKIKEWLKEKDKTFFTLSGFAGVGKSSIIKKILDDYQYGAVVSATTHKAKKVISNFTGKDAQTLHGLLGLRPDVTLDSYNPCEPQFAPIAVPRITDHNFCVVDEASMINKDLFDLIKEKTKDSRTKVLFMGDEFQIPPISEFQSAVFYQSDIEIFNLTKTERQNVGNPLIYLYDDLRKGINTIDGGFFRKTNINENGEGVIFMVNKKEFRKIMLEKFCSNEFNENSDFVKTIAWKNETVMASNKIIRTAIFGDKTDIVEVNDLLMSYRTVLDEKQRYSIIENSADYRVVEKSGLEENNYGISGYCIKLREDLTKGKFKLQDVFIIDANNHDNLHLYAQMHNFFRDMAKNNKKLWNKYYEFRRCNLLMKTIDKYQNGLYRNSGDIINKDLDYSYCITSHKCISENSRIQRNDGFIKLKNINIGDIICVGNNEFRKVLDKIYVGKKKAFKLTTSFGYEIICSEDHKILNIKNNFQELKKFNIGDYIPINRNVVNLNIDINQRDIYYYLGLLVADGSYAGNNKNDKYRIDLAIGFDDPDNIDFIKTFYFKNHVNCGVYYRKNSNMVNMYVSNKEWRNKLIEIGLNYVKGNDKSIPNAILTGTPQQKSNFIAGLFDGDGSIKGRGRLRFVNNSIILIKEVQNVLLEFGIISYYRKQRKAYTLVILGTSMINYRKYISFRLYRKVSQLNSFKYTTKTNCDFIPFRNEIINDVENDLRHPKGIKIKDVGIYPHSFLKFPKYAKYLSYKQLENIFKLYEINNKPIKQYLIDIYNKNYFYDKIININEIGEEEMYDLEIEDIHQFIADGFIVKNSQGSTYNTVFVLESDIKDNWVTRERNQIFYVAVSRPTTCAYVLCNRIDE